ncbi:hypothetical protein EB796_000399 [Bugula neritina]|uniref:Uncharacterized protein n=1 Tax=Bugula neritina TaxID=10212 RepID=A0A7J7KSU5_BUGNE|nr:hypothetical protein EB796_000399 [Bugula neritina]
MQGSKTTRQIAQSRTYLRTLLLGLCSPWHTCRYNYRMYLRTQNSQNICETPSNTRHHLKEVPKKYVLMQFSQDPLILFYIDIYNFLEYLHTQRVSHNSLPVRHIIDI